MWRINERATLSAVTMELMLGDFIRSKLEYSELAEELQMENFDEQLLSLSKSKSSKSSVVDMLDVVEQNDDVSELVVWSVGVAVKCLRNSNYDRQKNPRR